MLQAMRASAKYIWIIIVVLFVGGFLLAQTSGLLGRAPVTSTTAVASVNGEDILATTWYQATQNLEQEETQRSNQSISLDERQRLMDQAYDQLVSDALLRQEYRRRGITVTDDEILQAARYSPPPQLMQAPDLQTDGQFDPAKYQRFLASPLAKQNGLLFQLEQYYRTEIPKEKLFDQIASDVYISDEQLWRRFQDTHDSAQVSFVAFEPERISDSAVRVSDDEVRAYYDTHKKQFDRPGTAKVSIIIIPRTVSSADSAAVRNHALAVRARIVGGEKFEDVARAESADSVSAVNGGSLGRGLRARRAFRHLASSSVLPPACLVQGARRTQGADSQPGICRGAGRPAGRGREVPPGQLGGGVNDRGPKRGERLTARTQRHERQPGERRGDENGSERGADGSGFVATFDDITDLVSAQRTAAWADVARRIAQGSKTPSGALPDQPIP